MRNTRRPFSWLLGLLLVLVVFAVLYGRSGPSSTTETSGQLQQAVTLWQTNHTAPNAISNNKNDGAQISSDGSTVTWYDNAGTLFTTTIADSDQATTEFKSAGYPYYQNNGSDLTVFLVQLLPTLVIVGMMVFFVWWMLRQSQSGNNQAMSFGRSRVRHELLPALEEVFPGARRRLATLARRQRDLLEGGGETAPAAGGDTPVTSRSRLPRNSEPLL